MERRRDKRLIRRRKYKTAIAYRQELTTLSTRKVHRQADRSNRQEQREIEQTDSSNRQEQMQ